MKAGRFPTQDGLFYSRLKTILGKSIHLQSLKLSPW